MLTSLQCRLYRYKANDYTQRTVSSFLRKTSLTPNIFRTIKVILQINIFHCILRFYCIHIFCEYIWSSDHARSRSSFIIFNFQMSRLVIGLMCLISVFGYSFSEPQQRCGNSRCHNSGRGFVS